MYPIAQQWLKQVLGDNARFRDGQWEAIAALVEKRERVLVVQSTGWGKSLVYFLATRLLRSAGFGPTLLISPLLALMRNQVQAAERLGLIAESINSTNPKEHNATADRLLDGEIDLLLISPERLGNSAFQERVWPDLKQNVGLLVVDEVHCISDWGHDFRPDYRRILHILADLPARTPLLGTTATANDRVVRDVSEILGANLRILRGSLTRESLALHTFTEPLPIPHRLALLADLLGRIPGSGIIYCSTIDDCRRVSDWLCSQGFNAKPYFSGVEEVTGESRPQLEEQLLNNEVKALVASVALGMGFDKPDLYFVIHYQHPGSIVSYYQQIGRAGRAIEWATIVLMYGDEDEDIHRYFIETAFPSAAQVDQMLRAFRAKKTLTFRDLMASVNARREMINKILAHLEIEGIIGRAESGYRLLDGRRTPDYDRWQRITQQRWDELAQMQAYIRHEGCLMQFIARALDDPAPSAPCGRCQNCRTQPISFSMSVDPAAVETATSFLRQGKPIILKPRKQWPPGLPEPLTGKFAQWNLPGVALCHYHDEGYGWLVEYGKYHDGYFSNELVEAAASLLSEWWAQTEYDRPQWVTSIPSQRRPNLVPNFADRLAKRLGLPYVAAVQVAAEHAQQKTMENSYQQIANLTRAFSASDGIPTGPVLLVDDVTDSGWTLTIVGELLRQHGSGDVHPFALTKVGIESS